MLKIESDKVEVNIIFAGVGEVSESDVQLAAASKAVIIGFHTQIESHAEPLVKQLGVQVRLHNIIYHAIDDVKVLMAGLLEKIAQETEKGKALVKAPLNLRIQVSLQAVKSLKDRFTAAITFAFDEAKKWFGKEQLLPLSA